MVPVPKMPKLRKTLESGVEKWREAGPPEPAFARE